MGVKPIAKVLFAPEPESLAERLKKAKGAGAKLATATDTLNKRLKRLEKALVDLNLGISAFVNIYEEGDEAISNFTEIPPIAVLRFDRPAQAWGLYVDLVSAQQTVSITSASRNMRLRACGKLPELVANLVDQVEDQVTAVRRGTSTLDQLLEDLGAADPLDKEIPF
jgi:hypothetical protein